MLKYQVFSSVEWIYPDTKVNENGAKKISLIAARGSYACCQIVIDSICDGEISVEFIAEKAESGFMKNLELFRLVPVYVEKNTGPKGFTVSEVESAEAYTTRMAPFWVYDALKPIESRGEKVEVRMSNVGLYLSWPVPADTEPGVYKGRLVLGVGREICEVPVCLEVSRAIIPEKGTLSISNWFSVKKMAQYHNLEPWSEEHWSMIKQYGKLMRRGRQTHIWISKEVLDVRKNSDGTYSFNFDKAERLIRMYLELGFTHIEGGMVAGKLDYFDSEFLIEINDGRVKALSKEGYQYLHDYFIAWREFLKKNGWLGRLVQHVADEPTRKSATEYRILTGIVRKLLPGVPLIDALEIFGLDGSLDIWVLKNYYYENNREEFERLRRLGDRLWFYTCCEPGGAYMNRCLDFHLLRTRFLHWGNYIYNLEGYLHWGLNYYINDPFMGEAVRIYNISKLHLPPGDTHILYPGDKGPWSSVRFEAMRAGIEDYELLRIAAERSKEDADRIAAQCVRGFCDFTEDLKIFEKTYRDLLECASR